MNYGMTNHSTVISIDDKRYLVRTPGEGTSELINRQQEAKVYETIADLRISDDVVYIDPKSGVKITRFIEDTHTCDKHNITEVKACIDFLKHNLHEKKLKVNFVFDLMERIVYYRSLYEKSEYSDYDMTFKDIKFIYDWVKNLKADVCLTHIDANPDNFLIDEDGHIKLIDWEYAAMQDPHVDIAMFAIYSGYSKRELDRLINVYFEGEPDMETRVKIYAYVAMCGLLWSNWCEYKKTKGITYGDYARQQYDYAVEYAVIVKSYLGCHDCRHVSNAIILAAGKGTRLGDVTLNTPKPLIKVNDKPIIEYTIEALKDESIHDITVVVGYKAEQFRYLEKKYGVSIIYNPFYDESNNIVSLYLCSDRLADSLILDGDQIISKDDIPSLFNCSCYAYQDTKDYTTEWTMTFDKSGIVCDVNTQPSLLGGHQLRSMSVWLHEDSALLAKRLKEEVLKGNVNMYWDDIPCRLYSKDFFLSGWQVDSLIEIDTQEDLKKAEEALNEKAK